jgi:hypothetical protein
MRIAAGARAHMWRYVKTSCLLFEGQVKGALIESVTHLVVMREAVQVRLLGDILASLWNRCSKHLLLCMLECVPRSVLSTMGYQA